MINQKSIVVELDMETLFKIDRAFDYAISHLAHERNKYQKLLKEEKKEKIDHATQEFYVDSFINAKTELEEFIKLHDTICKNLNLYND